MIDLHLHSVYSDGLFTPEELCRLAVRRGCKAIALCDHDTTDGLDALDAACAAVNAENELLALRSIELSAGPEGRTHILGYGVNAASPRLEQALEAQRSARRVRDAEILDNLKRLNAEVPGELLPQDERLPLGRAHIARALVQTGAVRSVQEAFDRFLAEGRPAYVPYQHLTVEAAVALLAEAHAVPVLAHPIRSGWAGPALENVLVEWRQAGLRGLEAYHPSASHGQARLLERLARREGLLVTGGSDFHGDQGAHAELGRLPAGWAMAEQDLQALLHAMPDANM